MKRGKEFVGVARQYAGVSGKVDNGADWHWDGKEEKACTRASVITRTEEKNPKVKFSFSNGGITEYNREEYANFQCNRYWVEQCFDDAKNELGFSVIRSANGSHGNTINLWL